MKKIIVLCLIPLAGCASTAQIQKEMYSQRVAEQSKVDQGKLQLEAARYLYGSKLLDPSAQLAFAISDGIASALRASGAGQTQLPPMPIIEGWDDKLLKFAGILAPVAANVAGSVMQYKLGVAQTQANRDISLGDQRARVDTVAAVASGMGAAGTSAVNAVASVATSGFTAISSVARDGFGAVSSVAGSGFATASTLGSRVTNITTFTTSGDHNAVAAQGSTATVTTPTTNTNNCPGASGGNGAASGNTGSVGTSPAGTVGIPGTPGATGAGGTGTAGAVNCTNSPPPTLKQ